MDKPQQQMTSLGKLNLDMQKHYNKGNFNTALEKLTDILEIEHDNTRYLRMAAWIHYRNGQRAKARYLACKAANLKPVNWPRQSHSDKKLILRTSGIKNASYALRWDDRYQTYDRRVNGGHFSTRFFLSDEFFDTGVMHITDSNLDRLALRKKPDVIVNTISCPDLHRDALQCLERFLQRYPDLPVINPPDKVLLTSREQNYQRLSDIPDLRFPKTIRLIHNGDTKIFSHKLATEGISPPLILRPCGTHTGEQVTLIRSSNELELLFKTGLSSGDYYAIEYLDTCDSDNFYHKTRAFFMNRSFYPVAHLTSRQWQIHSGDRYEFMSADPQSQIWEQNYLKDPQTFLGDKAFNALSEVAKRIDLDFFGIDFTVNPHGELVIFEVNPVMRHNYDHADTFPYTRSNLDKISADFDQMVTAQANGVTE